jgi:hypothetical protein
MALLLAAYVSVPGVFQGKHSGDGFFGFAYLRALVFHHTLDMQGVLPTWVPFFGLDPVTHHMPNRNPIGPLLFWMPFYLLACAGAWVYRLFGGAALGPDSAFHAWMAALGTLLGVLLGARQLFILCRRHATPAAARLALFAVLFGTPVAWYTVVQPLYQHGLAFAASALFVERWDASRGEVGRRRYVLLGLLGGWAASVRLQELLFLLLPIGELAAAVVRGDRRRERIEGALLLGGGLLVAFVPQLLVWRYYGGSLWKPVQVEPLRLGEPEFVTTLFSMRGGLLPWSPVVYACAACFGWALYRRRQVALLVGLAAIFVVNLWVVASAWVLSGGYGFGARRLSDGATLFAVALAIGWAALPSGWVRRATVGFVALCVALTTGAAGLQQRSKSRSTSAMARTRGAWLREVKGPEWLARLLETTGDPFVQPAGGLFALLHRAPLASFEAVVGQAMLERDGQWFQVIPDSKSIPVDRAHRFQLLGGLDFPERPGAARVTGPIRALVPLFLAEEVAVVLVGSLRPGVATARCNGHSVQVAPHSKGARLTLPDTVARHGLNELVLDLPPGSTLERLEFSPTRAISRPR